MPVNTSEANLEVIIERSLTGTGQIFEIMNKEQEIPKRLTPTLETLRELYLKSGNQCAFLGCQKEMINAQGQFIGQICHIEAAMRGGERFNENQTNEDRRSYSNLMLMCYEHHIETNDVDKFTVGRLKEFKRLHESKYIGAAEKIQRSIIDLTTVNQSQSPKSLRKLASILDYDLDHLTPRELELTLEDFRTFEDRLGLLPEETRQVLCIVVRFC